MFYVIYSISWEKDFWNVQVYDEFLCSSHNEKYSKKDYPTRESIEEFLSHKKDALVKTSS